MQSFELYFVHYKIRRNLFNGHGLGKIQGFFLLQKSFKIYTFSFIPQKSLILTFPQTMYETKNRLLPKDKVPLTFDHLQ